MNYYSIEELYKKEDEIHKEWEEFMNDDKYSYYLKNNIELWKTRLEQ